MAGVLGQCKTLAVLDLRCNRIGSEGAGRLAGVLGDCRLRCCEGTSSDEERENEEDDEEDDEKDDEED
eukprot:2788859-Rhodomonas_salina.2